MPPPSNTMVNSVVSKGWTHLVSSTDVILMDEYQAKTVKGWAGKLADTRPSYQPIKVCKAGLPRTSKYIKLGKLRPSIPIKALSTKVSQKGYANE